MTNDRLRDEVGQIELVPPQDRIYGPGSGPIMAAFTHLNPNGSRFSDGSYGVFYAAASGRPRSPRRAITTATSSRRRARARCTCRCGSTTSRSMRGCTTCAPTARSTRRSTTPTTTPPRSAWAGSCAARARTASCTAACAGRAANASGLFKPRGASACLHAAVLLYAWDGATFTDVYEKLA